MFFEHYLNSPEAKIDPSLLWEYNLNDFNYQEMRHLVVQRVIERGWLQDWYAILNLYGVEGVKEAIKELTYLHVKDMNFVSTVFQIPIQQLKCYEKKQLHQQHWHS